MLKFKLKTKGKGLVKKTLGKVKKSVYAVQELEAQFQMLHHKVKKFRPHVEFEFEKGNYIVQTARNGHDLEECLRLRFEVFHREMLKSKRRIGVDIDKIDFLCDHLIIREKRTGKVIGTYRMNCSRFTDVLYSAGEFDLSKVVKLPGVILELGRACINREHRTGPVMSLLWRGISEYISHTQSEYLIGCTSVKTFDLFEAASAYKYLQDKGHLNLGFDVHPIGKFKSPSFNRVLQTIEKSDHPFDYEEAKKILPPLLFLYIKAGAKICGEPAFDEDFSCIDFFTLLPVKEVTGQVSRKYNI